ncbi:hypothetical protein [Pseudomonas taiwanensis]|uniref:hypothetical protein n=1 Tax=Pseudomonas TaxID=286 RepID=UPI0028DD5533|nr:hypothetical protein [Pseudomonas taiwanensis]MDT8925162.1 hypothetical protein [Pseudomonas taiwanensis]
MQIDILIPEPGPLQYLAEHDALQLLSQTAIVHIPDLVAMSLIRKGMPGANNMHQWLLSGRQVGTVYCDDTPVGEALRLAGVSIPDYDLMGESERACRQWLLEQLEAAHDLVMILYEDPELAAIARNHDAELAEKMITAEHFLAVCAKIGVTSHP